MYVLDDSGQLAYHLKKKLKKKINNNNNKVKEGLQVRALLMKLERLTLEYGPVIVMYDPFWSWTDKKSFPRGETRFTQKFSNMSALKSWQALAFNYPLMPLFRIFPLTFDILVIISTP